MSKRIQQENMFDRPYAGVTRPLREILSDLARIRVMYEAGLLGGAVMPEDCNPGLSRESKENYHFFTLPMALNYQRNSYSLWEAATKTFEDPVSKALFDPVSVISLGDGDLRDLMSKYRLALQPNNHCKIWRTLCGSICELFSGDIRQLFVLTGNDVPSLLQFVQRDNKASFPYLAGPKICNYWLYVMSRYTDVRLVGREALNVAPDTHVVQASVKLGLIDAKTASGHDGHLVIARAWSSALQGTGIAPIDLHTPLWLWSRSGFVDIV